MLKRQLEEEFENIVRTPATISVTEPRPCGEKSSAILVLIGPASSLHT